MIDGQLRGLRVAVAARAGRRDWAADLRGFNGWVSAQYQTCAAEHLRSADLRGRVRATRLGVVRLDYRVFHAGLRAR